MLNLLRKSLQTTLARFGMELRSKSLHEQADDPYNALFHLMPEQEALIIIDAGASIGQTSAKLAHLYPEATITNIVQRKHERNNLRYENVTREFAQSHVFLF